MKLRKEWFKDGNIVTRIEDKPGYGMTSYMLKLMEKSLNEKNNLV